MHLPTIVPSCLLLCLSVFPDVWAAQLAMEQTEGDSKSAMQRTTPCQR